MQENNEIKEILSEFLDEIPCVIFDIIYNITSETAKITFINETAKIFLLNIIDYKEFNTGFKLKEIIGSNEQLINIKVDIQKIIGNKEEAIIKNQEFIIKTKNNKKIIIQTSYKIKFISDTDIMIRGTLTPKSEIITQEIDSQEVDAKISIKEKVGNLKSFFENFDAIIMILNEEGRIQFISPNVGENILYKAQEEIIGRKLEDIFPAGQSEFFYTHFQEAINTSESIDFEYHLPIENKLKWFQSRIIPVLIKDGKYMQVVAIIRDITRYRIKPIDDI
ncbi:MAG TPA: PAS domain-containing protein [Candidatus Bathyarchaeia archaeon]|nr:PAS domain-containing protein [Candidatus Bathyarchaeia archaeon]